jgi:hypothetical protein
MMSLVEIWCLLVLLSIPFLNIQVVKVGELSLAPVDLLFPVLAVIAMVTLLTGRLVAFRNQKLVLLLLLFLLGYQLFDVVLLQGDAATRYLQLLLSQLLGFAIFYSFSRVSSRSRALQFLEALVWVSAMVTIVSIAAQVLSSEPRLDSPLWGKSNAFAAALTIPTLVGIVLVHWYHRRRVILPVLVNTLGLFATQSRGGIVLFFLGIGLLWGVAQGRHAFLRLAAASALVTFLLIGCISLPTVQNRIPVFGRLADDVQALRDYGESKTEYDLRRIMSGRFFVWQSAVQTISQNPAFGSKDTPLYVPPEPGQEPRLVEREEATYHSWLLSITAQLGIVGLALNLVAMLVALSPLLLCPDPSHRRIAYALLAVLSITLIHGLTEPIFEAGFFLVNTVSILFWMVAGLSLRLLTASQQARI